MSTPMAPATPENDKMEAMSLEAVFGERMKSLPISSNKSMIGHTLTAAGAIEGGVLAEEDDPLRRRAADDQLRTPDPSIPLDVVPNVARNVRSPWCCRIPSASADRMPAADRRRAGLTGVPFAREHWRSRG